MCVLNLSLVCLSLSMGNINDGYITEASGLAYRRRSGQVDFLQQYNNTPRP